MTIHLTIPGTPCAKQRPKVTRNGAYTPEKTVAYEQHVRNCVMEQVTQQYPVFEKGVPVAMTAVFTFLRPESAKKGKKRREYPTGRPDIDNCTKAIQDALNNCLYHDDSQIVQLTTRKYYTNEPREVEAVVSVWEVKWGEVKPLQEKFERSV